MPIQNYDPPQLRIHQELERTTTPSVPRMGACILGPQYLLSRYGREETEPVPHKISGQTLPWRFVDDEGVAKPLPAGHKVDLDGAKLYAEGLRAPLATFDDDDLRIVLDSLSSPNIIKIVAKREFTTDFGDDPNELIVPGHTFNNGDKVRLFSTGTLPSPLSGGTTYLVDNSASGTLELTTLAGAAVTLTDDGTGTHSIALADRGSAVLAGTGLDALFQGRDTAVGDEVTVDDGAVKRTRTVIGLLGQDKPASYGTDSNKSNELAANASYNPVTDSVADSPVTLLAPAGFSLAIVQSSVQFNVRGSGISADRKVSEEYTITVTEQGAPGSGPGSAVFSISSKSGIYAATGVQSTNSGGDYLIDDPELAGATVTISGGTVSTGQVFRFRVYQAYERLAAPANIALSGAYTGPSDTTYVIEVVQGSVGDTATGAEVRIYDTDGIEVSREDVPVTDDTPIPLGAYGLSVKFNLSVSTLAQGGLRAGDKYFVHAAAASKSDTVFDKVVLDGPVVDPASFVEVGKPLGAVFSLRYTGEIGRGDAAAGNAWTPTDSGLEVGAALAMHVPSRNSGHQWVSYEDDTGVLHTSFRASVPTDSSQGMGSVSSDAEIAAKLGPIALENELAFGLSEALRGSRGSRVYYVNTGGDSAAHFADACKKLESTNLVWAICPLTEDPEVKNTVRNHVLAMSTPEKKNFRKLYVGIDSPGKYPIYERQSSGSPYLATVTDSGGGENLLVTLTPPADNTDFDSLSIVAGDLLLVAGAEYPISHRVSATELRLASGPALPIAPAAPIQIWKADTADSQAAFVNQAANTLNNRRATQIWYEDGTRVLHGTSPTIIPARFAAAEIAGLRSYLPPQVGLTRQEVQAITSAPAMYNKYGIDDLDRIASEGTMIVTQTAESGGVYIRHQLTTDTDNGLLYYEDNVTMIVDYLSFRFRDEFEDLIGKVNVTDTTIANLFSRSVTLLDAEKQTDLQSVYGPLLVDYSDLVVERDPVLRDRINIRVKIQVPIPMNTLDITFETYVELAEAA